MNCDEFWRTPPGATPEIQRERHLRECAACTAQEERRRTLTGVLRSLAAESRSLGAPARVEARLLSAFRTNYGIPVPLAKPAWRGTALWASTAAAVLALAVFLVGGRYPQPPDQHARNAMELSLLQGAAIIDENTVVEERAPGFIALPNAATLAPNEEVNLVRLEVPRSAMMAVGLTVNEERALERVQADVMLGSDGLPRAVRFLE